MENNPDRVTYFAATDARGKRTPFGLKAKDRSRHMYVIGKTGMGKSTLLVNLAIQDIQNGEGLAFIDPHGSAVEELLDFVPENRVKDVVYFAPFDLDNPIAFNVMEDVGYDKRHLVVSGLMATFKKIWVDAWSARMEYILSNTLLALLEYPDSTLLGVNRMYTDKSYRKKVVENVKDPVVKDFWTKEFANYGDRYTQEATPAIQNKIGQFTSNPLIRNIIGQAHSSFDIREMMDSRKILLINLSKGLVGDTNMKLLGSMLTTRIFLGAMSRADLPGHELSKAPSFYFYVDEFQNFANESFSEILSEARKYQLNLIIAHQYVEQMEEEVRAAVFGNVGTTVVFRVGPFDAETLETVFMPKFTQEDLVNLGFAQIYLTLMIDGVGSPPFSAVTIPPIEAPARSYKKEVIEASRTQFASKRAAIEESIIAEFALLDEMPEPKAAAPRYPRSNSSSSSSSAPRRESAAPRREPSSESRPPAPRETSRNSVPDTRESRSEEPREQRAPREPQSDGPRESTSREPRESRGDRERAAPRQESRPPARSDTKSAEDLKEILRKTIASSQKSKVETTTKKQENLKDTLRGVVSQQVPAPEKKPEQQKPFEVPQDVLTSIFKNPL